MKQHPNKHIQAAIDYALSKGWIWVAAGGAAHCFFADCDAVIQKVNTKLTK